MVSNLGQTFTVTFPQLTDVKPVSYKLVLIQIIDNDTDREFKLLREDGAITEVEYNWFDFELTGRKITIN